MLSGRFLPGAALEMGSGTKKDKILMVVAIVVIIAALGILGFTMVGGDDVDTGPDEYHVQCLACKSEVVYSAEELGQYQFDPDRDIGTVTPEQEEVILSLGLVKCKDCGGSANNPFTGVIMRQCPNCKEFYIPAEIQQRLGLIRRVPEGPEACPHCKQELPVGAMGNLGE